MRTWKDCAENPTKQERESGRAAYARKIETQAKKVCRLEDKYNETGKDSDYDKFIDAEDEFYEMRECFNEW